MDRGNRDGPRARRRLGRASSTLSGWLIYRLPAYDIDKFEVTNAQYQEFVDQGGYRKPEYWKEKFVKDGKELSGSRRWICFAIPPAGPGLPPGRRAIFPPGQADYPVSGVSWYEAAAYAAFAGKSLPAIGQWFKAAPARPGAVYVSIESNFGGQRAGAGRAFSGRRALRHL